MSPSKHDWAFAALVSLTACGGPPLVVSTDTEDATTGSGASTAAATGGNTASSAAGTAEPGADTGSGDSTGTGGPESDNSCEGLLFDGRAEFGRAERTGFGAVDTNLLFTSAAGLELFDFSDSTGLSPVGTLAGVRHDARDVSIDAGIAVLFASDLVTLVDVSQPDTPSDLAAWNADGEVLWASKFASRVAVRTETTLSLVDVSDPTAPIELASEPLEQSCVYVCPVALSDTRLFMLDSPEDTANVHVWDVADDDLVPGGVVGLGAHYGVMHVAADATRAVIATAAGLGQISVVDAADPDNAALVGAESVAGGRTLVLDGTLAITAWAGMSIVDVSGPPIPLGMLEGWGAAGGALAVVGDEVFSFGWLKTDVPGLMRADVTDPMSPTPLSAVELPLDETVAGETVATAWYGDYLLLADSNGGLRVFDAADPSAPVEVGVIETPESVNDVITEGGRAWMREASQWVEVELDDPTSPSRGQSLPGGTPAFFSGDLFVVIDSHAEIYDLSGEVATVVGTYTPSDPESYLFWVVVAGDYMIVSGNEQWFVDISNPSAPIELSKLGRALPYYINGSVGEYFVSSEGELLSVEGGELSVLGALPYGRLSDFEARTSSGHRVYQLIDQSDGALVTVTDISDPLNPVLAATLPLGDRVTGEYIASIDTENDLVAVPAADLFVRIVDADCDP